jgi:hypothetical protein
MFWAAILTEETEVIPTNDDFVGNLFEFGSRIFANDHRVSVIRRRIVLFEEPGIYSSASLV